MGKEQESDGFGILLADHNNSTSYFEETDGTHRQWSELSAEGKLAYIARDAALYDVPFERFAQAVQDVLGGQPSAVREEASLRLALSNERELHGLAKLLPPDHSGTESTPLVERFKELLAGHDQPTPKAADPMVMQELLTQIQELVSTRFVDSFFPADGLAFRADNVPTDSFGKSLGDDLRNAKPFAALSEQQKWDVIESYIDWEYFRERGSLDYLDADKISSNVRHGKSPDRWLEGTSCLACLPQPIADQDSQSKNATTATLRDQLFAQPQPQPPSPSEHTNERQHKR